MKSSKVPIVIVLLSAFLFGLSTPLCKLLVGDISAQMMAALLYLGSGLGMTLTAALRASLKTRTSRLSAREWLWFTGPDIFLVKTYAKVFDKPDDLTKARFCQP